MQLLRSANRLRELTWAGPTDQLLTLSFTNLTSLTLSFSGVPTFHLLRILQLAVQLKQCSTEVVGTEVEEASLLHGLHVISTNLESLEVEAYDGSYDMATLLDRMTLPTLQKLSISGKGGMYPAEAQIAFSKHRLYDHDR